MKSLLIVILTSITTLCYAQGKTQKTDSIKIIYVNDLILKTMIDFENQVKAIQEKQQNYLKGVFESNGYNPDKVKNLKFENGKFIFITEK